MPKRLKKANSKPDIVGISELYCRKCMKLRGSHYFFKAVDAGYLDANGFMSVCKDCINDIYQRQWLIYRDIGLAIYNTCKILNIRYDERLVELTKTQAKTQNKLDNDPTIFGIYKSKMWTVLRSDPNDKGQIDFTFYSDNQVNVPDREIKEDEIQDSDVNLVKYWGEGYTVEDYRFLEEEMASWKRSYSCQTKAEEFFMKQICLKILELEKTKLAEKPTDNLLKGIQELLKNAALTPAQQTAASSGKGVETWGTFIKNIEETEPAEYYKDKNLFEDFDGLGAYIRKYITRAIKNFVTGSRDFNIVDDETSEEYELVDGEENVEKNAFVGE